MRKNTNSNFLGFVVNFYDYMIDKSLRTRLIQARKQIMRKEYEKKY